MFGSKRKENRYAGKQKRCAAIVPAAGSSLRMGGRNKLFENINGVPVIILTLSVLQNCKSVDEIIIPAKEADIVTIAQLCRDFGISKVTSVIKGGETRAESVFAGVLCAGKRFDLIAVHDAARPLVTEKVVESAILAASKFSAAAPAVPVKDTIKTAEKGIVTHTLDRDCLFSIQTPQVFDSSLISAALSQAVSQGAKITDDCSAVEAIGMRVVLTEGDYSNIKITTPEDLLFASAVLSFRNEGNDI